MADGVVMVQHHVTIQHVHAKVMQVKGLQLERSIFRAWTENDRGTKKHKSCGWGKLIE